MQAIVIADIYVNKHIFFKWNWNQFPLINIDEVTLQQFIYTIAKKGNPRSQARVISGSLFPRRFKFGPFMIMIFIA